VKTWKDEDGRYHDPKTVYTHCSECGDYGCGHIIQTDHQILCGQCNRRKHEAPDPVEWDRGARI